MMNQKEILNRFRWHIDNNSYSGIERNTDVKIRMHLYDNMKSNGILRVREIISVYTQELCQLTKWDEAQRSNWFL